MRARLSSLAFSSPAAVSRGAFEARLEPFRSSAAALIVNVTAEIRSTVVAPLRISSAIRSTRLVVLPVPAAASTRSVTPRSSRIARRASASGQRRGPRLSLRHGSPGKPAARAGPTSRACPSRRRRGGEGAAADGLVVAEAAVLLVGRVRERPRAEQIEERDEGVARLGGVERHRHALSLALAPREEVARARHRAGDAGRAPRRTSSAIA